MRYIYCPKLIHYRFTVCLSRDECRFQTHDVNNYLFKFHIHTICGTYEYMMYSCVLLGEFLLKIVGTCMYVYYLISNCAYPDIVSYNID